LGNLTWKGTGYFDATSGCGTSLHWDDGDAPSRMNGTYAGLWWNGAGHSASFTAPADPIERTLRIYVGGIEGATGKLTARLSDGSAPDFVSNTWSGNLALRWFEWVKKVVWREGRR
jgi:hypothetical protein